MSQAAGAAPARASRFAVIDGLRGCFLVLMALGHVKLGGELAVRALDPTIYSFADAGYGFVFVSGIVAGLVYGRTMMRQGFGPAARRMLRRALTLYLYAVAIVLGLVVAAQLIPDAERVWGQSLGPLLRPDARALLAAALLLQAVEFGDILIQYILYLALAPLVIWGCLNGRALLVLGLSGALWLATQFGLLEPALGLIENFLRSLRGDLHPPPVFNVAAWQFLFVCGLAIGVLTAKRGPEAWRPLIHPNRPAVFYLALAVMALGAAVRLAGHLAGDEQAARWFGPYEPLLSEHRAGAVPLVAAAAATIVLAWLTMAAPQSRHAFWRWSAGLLRGFLQSPFLQLLGRHSLLVYACHVPLAYAVMALGGYLGPIGEPAASVIGVLMAALIAVPAWWRERGRRAKPVRLEPRPA